ncbi:MAG: fumarylacetoacetate hydrolase family protein [Myxococcota bacterium]
MRLIAYGPAGQEKPGILLSPNQALCLWGASQQKWLCLRDIFEADPNFEQLRAWQAHPPREHLFAAKQVRMGPPITNPTKIIGVGLNYRSHAEEQNKPIPKHPLLFCKASTSLAGHQDPIWIAEQEEHLDYEVELAIVIKKRCIRIQPEDWQEVVAGYMIFNDISARDAQRADQKWFRAKSFDTTSPCGPILVTADQIPTPEDLFLQSTVNDEIRQQGRTSDLIFSIGELLSFCSRNMTLVPGDILTTGTPCGVGIHRRPPRCLQHGDRVTASIEGLGMLSNTLEHRPAQAMSVYPHP